MLSEMGRETGIGMEPHSVNISSWGLTEINPHFTEFTLILVWFGILV